MTNKEQIGILKIIIFFSSSSLCFYAVFTEDFFCGFIGFVLLLTGLLVQDGKTKKKEIETEKSIDIKILIKKWYDDFIKWISN